MEHLIYLLSLGITALVLMPEQVSYQAGDFVYLLLVVGFAVVGTTGWIIGVRKK